MYRFMTKLNRDEKGVTALEYGLIAALIAIAIVASVTQVGASLTTTFTNVKNAISTANK